MALQTLGSTGFDKYIPFSSTDNGDVNFGSSSIVTCGNITAQNINTNNIYTQNITTVDDIGQPDNDTVKIYAGCLWMYTSNCGWQKIIAGTVNVNSGSVNNVLYY